MEELIEMLFCLFVYIIYPRPRFAAEDKRDTMPEWLPSKEDAAL